MLVVAFGAVLAAAAAAGFWSEFHLYGLSTLQPVHYLGRDAYDLSAIRRQPAHRNHTPLHPARSQPDPL
jgi:hypothetical protein